MPSFLNLGSAGADGVRAILDEAHRRKGARAGLPRARPDRDAPLDGHILAAIFEKPSTRTRISFDVAMRQLGGSVLTMAASDMQIGRGESLPDTARILSRFVDLAMIRCHDHDMLVELAANADIPFINGLTDLSHPCQFVADMLTVEEHLRRPVAQTRWAWFGDVNNMLYSMIEGAALMGFSLNVATPRGYAPSEAMRAAAQGGQINFTHDPRAAAEGVDIVVTDTWLSMGQDRDLAKLKALEDFQVTSSLMKLAHSEAIFLHCLPAHRGEEVEAAVIDGPQSVVWDEAENRVHAQKAIILWCMNKIAQG